MRKEFEMFFSGSKELMIYKTGDRVVLRILHCSDSKILNCSASGNPGQYLSFEGCKEGMKEIAESILKICNEGEMINE